jgi:Uncharacterized protein conserved in bacteria (DUF2225)
MTTMFPQKETCLVCGNTSEHMAISSTNTFGSPDLDLRPPEMQRSTITHWVQRCPTCGYCASSISRGPEIAKQIVTSSEYVEQRDNPDFPALANQFLCWALIQAAAGDDANAGRAAVDAAWICDDKQAMAKADICRRKAIALFTNAKAKGQQFAGDDATEMLVLADLYRRTGQFDQVESICNDGLARHPADLMQSLFSAQRRLARNQDRQRHTVEEAMNLQKQK